MSETLKKTNRLTRALAVAGGASIIAFQGLALLVDPPAWTIAAKAPPPSRIGQPAPLADGGREFTVASTDTLLRLYERADFTLGAVRSGDKAVPRLYLAALPHDVHELERVGSRKRLFIRVALPLILRVNAEIDIVRTRAAALMDRVAAGKTLSHRDDRWLTGVARHYGVLDTEGTALEVALDAAVRRELLLRIDGVPPSLALAQTIVESGWGRSRFAREGNALFGQWTWDRSQGIVPVGAPDAAHAVKSFESLSHSVRGYMHNLNTHRSYDDFRLARSRGATARDLARTLTDYSERGAVYGEELVDLINENRLDQFDDAALGVTLIRRGGGWDSVGRASGG
jgi:Bax protein